MDDNLGRDKIPQWNADVWGAIDKAVADEHKLTAVAAQFLTPPVLDTSHDGTVRADKVLIGEGGVLSVDEGAITQIIEISVQFKVRPSQIPNEEQLKTTQSLATRAANLLARGEDLLIFQGSVGLQDPLFTSQAVVLITPDPKASIEGLLPADDGQKIKVEPAEVNQNNPALTIYGENTYAAVAKGYAILQEHHYGRQALVLPTTIYSDTYATRATTLDIPAITADRIKGLIGNYVYGTGSLPPVDSPDKTAKGVLLALDGDTVDLVVQTAPSVAVVTQDPIRGDYVFKVFERFALRLKDRKAVVELDFVPQKTAIPQGRK